VAFGVLATSYPVFARRTGSWFSVPNIVTALLSTAASIALFAPPPWPIPNVGPIGGLVVWVAACLALGLACGVARERSGSVAAPAVLHGASAAIAWWVLPLIGG
jgi:membrane protease YdiL (CAAX protease family)